VRDIDVAIGALQLDGGERLPAVEQRVTIYGDIANPAVLLPHALTGSSRVAEWWPAVAAPGGVFDPREKCVIGINALGSCYGSTGPASSPHIFPRITVRDIVRAQARALDELGIARLEFVAGGSLGGMQALQWALAYPERVGTAIVVAAHDHHSAMGIALNAIQRECLELDPLRGLRTARKLATLTYKSEALLRQRHGTRRDRHGVDRFDIEGYLDRQADLFETRMDAASYAALTHAMDSFDVRDAGIAPPRAAALHFIGISSDWLFRAQDVRGAAARFASFGYRASYRELRSDHGHDAFLAEAAALRELMAAVKGPPEAAPRTASS
jgi:homoserine O-acetyltransferase/O-succinyltransferase